MVKNTNVRVIMKANAQLAGWRANEEVRPPGKVDDEQNPLSLVLDMSGPVNLTQYQIVEA